MDEEQKKAMEEYMKQMQQLTQNLGGDANPLAGMMTPEMMAQFTQGMQEAGQNIMNAYTGGVDLGDLMGQLGSYEELDYDEFVAAHPVAPGMEKYMAIGALLIATNDEPFETLVLSGEKEDFRDELESAWGIEGREDALAMIDSLLGGRHTAVLQPEYDIIQQYGLENYTEHAGTDPYLDEDDLESMQDAYECIPEILEIPLAKVMAVKSVAAWDIDRVGLLARLCSHVGYITEAEAYEYLKQAAAQAKAIFADWESYILSVIIGRALHLGLSEYVFAAAVDLLQESTEFLAARPISSL